MWPRNERDLPVAERLGRRRAGLGELSRDPSDLHDGDTGPVREHDGHLEDDLQLVADGVGVDLAERLRAVARLEDEGPAIGHMAERLDQTTRLAGEDERRKGGERVERARKFG